MASRANVAKQTSDVAHRRYPVLTEPFDDMHDGPEETSRYPALPFDWFMQITRRFEEKDKDALLHQRRHMWSARIAIGGGTIAVTAAIVELATEHDWPSRPPVFAGLEFVAVVIAGLCWWRAHRDSQKYNWLGRRHQAELYRQLKFKFLIRPRLWSNSDWLDAQLDEIENLHPTEEGLQQAIERPLLHGPFDIQEHLLPRRVVRHLVEYYLAKRLNPQKEYLANRAQSNEFQDRPLALLPFLLFVLSIFVAGLHGGLVGTIWLFQIPGLEGAFGVAAFLAMIAACLPVLSAFVRTSRAAFEFSRNRSRFHAAHGALSRLESVLVRDGIASLEAGGTAALRVVWHEEGRVQNTLSPGSIVEIKSDLTVEPLRTSGKRPAMDDDEVDASRVLRELWWCEHILATEHMEWLRLMMEAEWYG